jgi:hypothetical protein
LEYAVQGRKELLFLGGWNSLQINMVAVSGDISQYGMAG